MRNIPLSNGFISFMLHTRYVRARIAVDEGAADLADQLGPIGTVLKELFGRMTAVEELVVERTALRDFLDAVQDAHLKRSERYAFDRVKGNRKDTWYRGVYPMAVSRVIRWAVADEVKEVHRVAGELAKVTGSDGKPDAEAQTLCAELKASATKVEDAVKSLAEATAQEASLRADVAQAKQRTNEVMRVLYGQLLQRFPGERDRVEAYFASPVILGLRRAGTAAEEPEAPEGPVAPPAI